MKTATIDLTSDAIDLTSEDPPIERAPPKRKLPGSFSKLRPAILGRNLPNVTQGGGSSTVAALGTSGRGCPAADATAASLPPARRVLPSSFSSQRAAAASSGSAASSATTAASSALVDTRNTNGIRLTLALESSRSFTATLSRRHALAEQLLHSLAPTPQKSAGSAAREVGEGSSYEGTASCSAASCSPASCSAASWSTALCSAAPPAATEHPYRPVAAPRRTMPASFSAPRNTASGGRGAASSRTGAHGAAAAVVGDEAAHSVSFPLVEYERVLGACHGCPAAWGLHVEQIPRAILAAASLASSGSPSEALVEARLRVAVPQPLLSALAPYQKAGVDFIRQREGRALLADESAPPAAQCLPSPPSPSLPSPPLFPQHPHHPSPHHPFSLSTPSFSTLTSPPSAP